MMAEDKLLRESIAAADPKKVYELYESWPDRAEDTLKQKVDFTPKKFDRIAYLAVGGSATAGDIISDWMLSSGGVEVSVFRGGLPKLRLDGTLVIICSTSGDTVETLKMAEAVGGSPAQIVTISHGGKLKEIAERQGLPHVEIGLAKAPRYSLPYSLFASVAVLRAASLLQGIEWELDDSISTMKLVRDTIRIEKATPDNPAKKVALALDDKQPCIYASSVTKSVARRFKNSLNENAKVHARFDSAPDIFHNEVEAWESGDASQQPVILRRQNDPPLESRVFGTFDALLRARGRNPLGVDGTGKGNLSQLMSLCYTLDFASYYVAILNGTEPFGIPLIDEMKRSR
jgi:glucose/mannose-6-phosphate isomerase